MKLVISNEFDVDKYNNLYNNWNNFKNDDPIPMKISIDKLEYLIPDQIHDSYTVVAKLNDIEIIGMATLFDKRFEHIRIGGIGKIAVNPKYRKNGVSKELLLYMKGIMERFNFDISILWASVLKVYESVGYKAYYKNMMMMPVKKDIEINMLLNLYNMPNVIGAW